MNPVCLRGRLRHLTALALASWVSTLPAAAQSSARPEPPPNIVIMVADDLGHADVGYRSPELHTPNIDRLSREGIRLERFYSAPVCSPTRAGLMTGRYPDRYGMRRGVIEPTRMHGLPPEEVTLAEVLEQAGYRRRAALGKWHLGHSSTRFHPLNQGFTRFYGHYNGAIDYFTHKRDGELDWHRDFDSSYEEGYSTDLLAAEAVQFIEDSVEDEPFFLYLAFNAVHSPMQAKPEHLEQHGYDPARGPFREGTGGQQRGEKDTENYGRIGNGNTVRQTYLGMLSSLDEGVGRVLEALDAEGIADNTLVLFLSDNGGTPRFGGDNRPLRGNKASAYEGGVRVNAIVRWPDRLQGGRGVHEVIAYVDVLPTLRRVAGITGPPVNPLDGVDVLDVLTGAGPAPERMVYLGPGAVVTREWKLVEGELFDITRDPGETTDLSDRHPDVLRRLTAAAAEFQAMEAEPAVTGRFATPPEWRIPGER